MASTKEQARKMVQTYLDEVEWGDDEFIRREEQKTRKERKQLPEGCLNSALYRDVMRIAWPSLVELLLASLASMVDMMMVGAMGPVIGDEAIAAVSLAAQPKFIFVSLIIALNAGLTAAVARARGAGDHDLANDTLRQGLLVSMMVCVFGSLVGYLAADPLIRFMANNGLSEQVIGMGVSYLKIQMAGFLTVGLSSTYTAALRGTGNSKIPMWYNIIANALNVAGNYALINGHWGCPALGVVGASLATVLGQAVATVIAVWATGCGKYYFHVRLSDFFHGFKVDSSIMYRQGGASLFGRAVHHASGHHSLYPSGHRFGESGLYHPPNLHEHPVPHLHAGSGHGRQLHHIGGTKPGKAPPRHGGALLPPVQSGRHLDLHRAWPLLRRLRQVYRVSLQ